MKRYIFIAAALVLATVSCSKVYDVTPVTQPAIGFGSWADVMTKSRTVGDNTFAADDYFYVYGFNTITSSPTNTNIFDDVSVSTTDGTTWTYSPIRYWDGNTDSYTFYAVSPSEASIAAGALLSAHDVQAGTFTSTDRTFNGHNEDILVADKKVVEKANYNKDVLLNFRHAAAKFDLKVRKGPGLVASNATLKISKIELQNIQTKGHFIVTGYNASDHATAPYKANIARWTLADTPVPGTFTSTDDVSTSTVAISSDAKFTVTSAASGDTPYGSDYLIQDLIVMPQDFVASATTPSVVNGQKLVISYEITTGADATAQTVSFTNKEYDLVLFDNTDIPTDDDSSTEGNQYNDGTKVTGWDPGVHYTYVITIDANAITFTAQIQSWGDAVGGYYYLVN